MRFSQRHGYSPIKNVVQVESMDDDLRNALWSALKICFWDSVLPTRYRLEHRYQLSGAGNEGIRQLCNGLWLNLFKQPLDTLSDSWDAVHLYLRDHFFACKWFEAYDFIEFVAQTYQSEQRVGTFTGTCNKFLEREVSAWRFVDKSIVRIVSPEELSAVEDALKVKPGPIQEHLQSALTLLADRRKPDYRNSVKESISAVEAMAREAKGKDKGTLSGLLQGLGLHPALEGAFKQLYGYTSDSGGIRHALIEGDRRVSFEEAKFMLVACSAFINYVNGSMKS